MDGGDDKVAQQYECTYTTEMHIQKWLRFFLKKLNTSKVSICSFQINGPICVQ